MNKAKADKIFNGFMKRVAEINEDKNYIYRVSRLILFGSYLNPAADDYGDIDIAYELEHKINDCKRFSGSISENYSQCNSRWESLFFNH